MMGRLWEYKSQSASVKLQQEFLNRDSSASFLMSVSLPAPFPASIRALDKKKLR